MKKNILYACFGALLIFASACEPIEERQSLEPSISEGEFDNSISVSVEGNTIKCSTSANGVVFWETTTGKQANQKTPDFYVPLAGTVDVTCSLFGGADKVVVKKTVSIAQNDPAYYSSPLWELLTNNADGKTWVWATDKPGGTTWGVGPWFSDAGVLNGNVWWGQRFPELADQGTTADDELYFDLNMKHNYQVTQNEPGARPGSATGTFDMKLNEEDVLTWSDGSIYSYGTITFTGTTVPLGFENNTDGVPYHYEFDILTLTEDELVLGFPEPGVDRAGEGAWGAGWFYQFKRKGYNY